MGADLEIVRVVADHRWGPLTLLMRAASAWWFKSLVLVGIGLAADLAPRGRPRMPLSVVPATLAYALASVLADLGKRLTDRPRPDVSVVGAVPDSSAMPSAHAATAAAVAVVVGLLHPRLRVPMLVLAGLVGASRVYLGVHHPTDVLAGWALGAAVALAIVPVWRRALALWRFRRGCQTDAVR